MLWLAAKRARYLCFSLDETTALNLLGTSTWNPILIIIYEGKNTDSYNTANLVYDNIISYTNNTA